MIWNRSEDESHRLVDAFAELMKHELDENFFKGDRDQWINWSLGEAIWEIRYHLEKLENAVEMKDADRVKEHTADVANCAMFLADIYGVCQPVPVKKPEPPSQPRNRGNYYSYSDS